MLNWCATPDEHRLMLAIAQRVEALDTYYPDDTQTLVMDLEACHCNGCPLALEELSRASAGDLIHDVMGIRQHLDRKTGRLGDCFTPRYALSNHMPEVL